MKIYQNVNGDQVLVPGDWAHGDGAGVEVECPECGSAPGACCSFPDPNREGFAIEVGAFVHVRRVEFAEFHEDPRCQDCKQLMKLYADCEWPTDKRLWLCHGCLTNFAEKLLHSYEELTK